MRDQGWTLMDLSTGISTYFEKFEDCFPERESPLDVQVEDKFRYQPPPIGDNND